MKTFARKFAVLVGVAIVSVGVSTSVTAPAHASTHSTHVTPNRLDTSWPI